MSIMDEIQHVSAQNERLSAQIKKNAAEQKQLKKAKRKQKRAEAKLRRQAMKDLLMQNGYNPKVVFNMRSKYEVTFEEYPVDVPLNNMLPVYNEKPCGGNCNGCGRCQR